MPNPIENLFKKIATAFSRAHDKHDGKTIRLNNKGLLLVQGRDLKFKIYVVSSNKNWLWIYDNINHQDHGKDNTVAVDLFGLTMPVKLVKHHKGLRSYTTYQDENGRELETLFSHSNKSHRLFWTIEKFNSLNAFDGDDKFTYDSLKKIEEMINEEYEDLVTKKELPEYIQEFDTKRVITEEDIKKANEKALEEYNARKGDYKNMKKVGNSVIICKTEDDDKKM